MFSLKEEKISNKKFFNRLLNKYTTNRELVEYCVNYDSRLEEAWLILQRIIKMRDKCTIENVKGKLQDIIQELEKTGIVYLIDTAKTFRHLMYIYESVEDSYRWAHVISDDLLHWVRIEDALIPDETDGGIYSGGVILEGEYAYVIYWALGKKDLSDGIRIARSKKPYFNKWEKLPGYVIKNTELGITKVMLDNKEIEIGSADPSNIWKNNGKYYVQLGNLCLLNKYRDQIKNNNGAYNHLLDDHAALLESTDLKNWHYVKEFYKRHDNNEFTTMDDDIMCPFFGILPYKEKATKNSQKYLELFLSRNRGVQYYIGDYDKENNQFVINSFGKMSFVDNALFAPGAFYASDGRLISFYWQRDNQDDDLTRERNKGWSGIHTIPRELFLNEDNSLGIAPIR